MSLPFLTLERRERIRDIAVKSVFALWALWLLATLINLFATSGHALELTPTVYYLVETVDFDAGSRLVRYVKAFDNLSDCVHERDRPSQSKRLACVASGAPGEDT